jgi:hypothetical protein
MARLLERFWLDLPLGDESSQTFFYEVIPSAHIEVPSDGRFTYEARAALTEAVRQEVVPGIWRAVGLIPSTVRDQLGPGGYQRRTNPSLQAYLAITDERARMAAAALGWVFRQESVLVADLRDQVEGRTGYVVVDLGPDKLLPERAHAFFLHAANTVEGLGGGYTAFDDDMLFLNMRDDTGEPYSQLDDEAFSLALQRSAKSFDSYAALGTEGVADARFVGNNWSEAADGEQYAMHLTGADLAALTALRDRHSTMVNAWLRDGGVGR